MSKDIVNISAHNLTLGDIDINLIEKYYPYSENGRLLIWKGSLPHRAAPINLITDDEYRITYQGHFLLKPDKILYFW